MSRSALSSVQLKEQWMLPTQVPHSPVHRKWHHLGLHMCTSECQVIIKYPIIKWHKTVCKERDGLKPEDPSLIQKRPERPGVVAHTVIPVQGGWDGQMWPELTGQLDWSNQCAPNPSEKLRNNTSVPSSGSTDTKHACGEHTSRQNTQINHSCACTQKTDICFKEREN